MYSLLKNNISQAPFFKFFSSNIRDRVIYFSRLLFILKISITSYKKNIQFQRRSSLFRIQTMIFRMNLFFLYTIFCLLTLYNANEFVAAKWLKVVSMVFILFCYFLIVQRVKMVGFSWKNCGSETDPAQVKGLYISPDPIIVPGKIIFLQIQILLCLEIIYRKC